MALVGETSSNSSHVEMTMLRSGHKARVKWGHSLATNLKDKCAVLAHPTQFILLEEPKEIFIAGVAILPHHPSLPTRERSSVSTKNNISSIQGEMMV